MSNPRPKRDWRHYIEAVRSELIDEAQADDASSDSVAGDQASAIEDCLRQLEEVRRTGAWREANSTIPGGSSARPHAAPNRIERFEIRRELGRGAHGVVVLAYDPSLRREVALKLPRPEVVATRSLRERFMREAHAAARLAHPGIVTVFEIGETWPDLYLASDYCSGGSLQKYLASQRNPLPPRVAAIVVAELARAVHHAHSHGVLHRDIKPSNVLLAPRAKGLQVESAPAHELLDYRPLLGDFGLARLSETDFDRTATGTLIGTLNYMAPEQAEGRLSDVGPKSDVYGLGAVLYELLTGQPPLRGSSDADTLRQILFVEPANPRRLRGDVPTELAAICLRALEKDPRQRYSSAELLADDLERHLAGRPTLAKPPSPVARAAKWARRRPAIAALLAVSFVALVSGFSGLALYNVQLRELTRQAQASEHRAESLLYVSDMRFSQQLYKNGGIEQMRDLLARHVPEPGQPDRRDFAWYYLHNLINRDLGTLPRHPGDVYGLAYSPDGRHLATTCRDGHVRIWNVADRTLLHDLPTHEDEAGDIRYSPDGRRVTSVGDDGRVVIRDGSTFEILHAIQTAEPGTKPEQVSAFEQSPDGERYYVGVGRDVLVYSASTGELLRRLDTQLPARINDISISANEKTLLAVGDEAIYFDIDTFRYLGRAAKRDNRAWSAGKFFPRGNEALLMDHVRDVYVHSHRTWERVELLGRDNSQKINKVAISGDMDAMVAISADGIIQIFDHPRSASERQVTRRFRKHGGRIWDVKIAPDGKQFATAGADGQVAFWPLDRSTGWGYRGDQDVLWNQPHRRLYGLAISSDGRFAASGNGRATVIVDRLTDRVLQLGAPIDLTGLSFSADCQRLLVTSTDANLHEFDVRTGNLLGRLPLKHSSAQLALSPDNDQLAIQYFSPASCELRSWPDFALKHEFKQSTNYVRFSPDGRQLAVCSTADLTIYDSETIEPIWRVGQPGESFFDIVWLDLHGKVVVAEGRNGVAIRNAETGALLERREAHPGDVSSLAAARQTGTFASACNANRLKVWHIDQRQPLLEFDSKYVDRSMEFSPAGDELLLAETQSHFQLSSFSARPQGQARPQPSWTWPIDMRELRVGSQFPLRHGEHDAWNIEPIGWSPNWQYFFFASPEMLIVWEETGKFYHYSPRYEHSPLRSLLMGQCSGQLLAVYQDGHAQWRTLKKRFDRSWKFSGPVQAAALQECEQLAAAACGQVLHVVDALTGQPRWQYDHGQELTGLVALDDHTLVTSDAGGVLRKFDFESGELTGQSSQSLPPITWLQRSAQSHQLVTLNADGVARLHDAETLSVQLEVPIPAEARRVYFVDQDRWLVFSDGNHPLINTADGSQGPLLPIAHGGRVLTVSQCGTHVACIRDETPAEDEKPWREMSWIAFE